MIHILEFIFTYRYEIFILVLAGFLGIEVISHVPSVLHTPLMSGANAIHGVIIVGGIILLGHADISQAISGTDPWYSGCFLCFSECCRRVCGNRPDA